MIEKMIAKEPGSKPNSTSMEQEYNRFLDFQSHNVALGSSHQELSMRDLCIDDSKNLEPKILGQTNTLSHTLKSSIDSSIGIQMPKSKHSKHNRSQDFTGKNKIGEKRATNIKKRISEYKKIDTNQSLSFGNSTKSRQPTINHSQRQMREKTQNKYENESMLSNPG